jgi:hypothetical protein
LDAQQERDSGILEVNDEKMSAPHQVIPKTTSAFSIPDRIPKEISTSIPLLASRILTIGTYRIIKRGEKSRNEIPLQY